MRVDTLEQKEAKRKRAKQKMAVIAGFKPISPLPEPVTTGSFASALWPGVSTVWATSYATGTATAIMSPVSMGWVISSTGDLEQLTPKPERVETIAAEKLLSWEDVDDIIGKL